MPRVCGDRRQGRGGGGGTKLEPTTAQAVRNKANTKLDPPVKQKMTLAPPQRTASGASTAAIPYAYYQTIALMLVLIGWTNFYPRPPTDAQQKGVMASNAGKAAISQSKVDFVNLSSHPSEVNARIDVITISPNATVPLRTHTHIVPGTNHCWRECPFGRNNKIIYTNSWRAGLNDRISIIDDMANLAGYLCATLEFPLPSASLTPRHNGNRNVSSSLVWDDFLVVAAVEDPNVTRKQEPSLLLLRDLKDELNNITESQKYSNEQWIKVVSKSASTVLSEFEIIYSTVTTADKNTKHFCWFFELDWYEVENSLADHFKSMRLINPPLISRGLSKTPPAPTSCIYRITKKSPRAEKISNHLWNMLVAMDTEHLARNATIGYLHIRRTDTTKQCNTTLDRIRSYLECSFMDVSGNVTLLLGTDEKDPNYIAGIQHIVENELSHGHKLLHLDSWISRKLKLMAIQKDDVTGKWNDSSIPVSYLNNYHVYLFEKYISSKAAFKLEQRTRWCNDCDPINEV
ncbi:hypothetical protein ACHAW5_003833 [Stephanodiscus triporus]|uniref:Uncharacterized protein n=1 Tax=Stephanodiscus triporus TaxID=2934178 RepID=A0ABD3P987_9STRA